MPETASREPASSSRPPPPWIGASSWAEVVDVGPSVRTIQAGDRVLFAPDAGFEVEIRGEEYLILRERDVHATASTRADGQSGLYL